MKVIAFLWLVTLAAVWICAAVMHYFERAWWSFPMYFTIVVCVSAIVGYCLFKGRDA